MEGVWVVALALQWAVVFRVVEVLDLHLFPLLELFTCLRLVSAIGVAVGDLWARHHIDVGIPQTTGLQVVSFVVKDELIRPEPCALALNALSALFARRIP